ncbi:MAG: tRNA (N6-threonylcarbamoyladenosine(37)-N6)-methyltransferase TrmO [Desulfobacterales bacterium]|jgi:tRNA-Thr(GGU) m(6)t(6)A37 methyltransferase TsaA|nr:tRNA (N6-threonylcarbamoyladenosine(37)-N6)-methyltransferase TrmO [Desulfobacterales bacterium]
MMITFEPIGVIRSCYKEKFGIPRQAGLVSQAEAILEMLPPYNREEAFRGLEAFSHIWVVFLFHDIDHRARRATVRPPRLGGNKRIGVFATRSGFRPNPIGMSAVALDGIRYVDGVLKLHLKGGDFLDDTPVLDIKPYIPYADCLPAAGGGFAASPPEKRFDVIFSTAAEERCRCLAGELPHLKAFITGLLQSDPRPAYYEEKPAKKRFGTRIYDFDIQWECGDSTVHVISIDR